jgi:CheY-like chemotaxis protein
VPRKPQRPRLAQRIEGALERDPSASPEAGRGSGQPGALPLGVLELEEASHFKFVTGLALPRVRKCLPLHSPAVGAQHTVLVVDDDPAIRLLCRVNLELDGHEVTEAGTLDDAREAIVTNNFDLVILDVHVAGGDGRDLLAELRTTRPHLPVALLTGSADRSELVRTGADALIPKPFTLEELRGTVEQLAQGRR